MAGQECRTRLFRTGCFPHSGQENEMARFKGQQSVHSPVHLCSWDSIPVFMWGRKKDMWLGMSRMRFLMVRSVGKILRYLSGIGRYPRYKCFFAFIEVFLCLLKQGHSEL